ncbi:MAG: hypothetical protein IPL35_05285 [Sphingobacteriales bacterium]|nr:hypothetical protein [Sphingobacteriales bacterium]
MKKLYTIYYRLLVGVIALMMANLSSLSGQESSVPYAESPSKSFSADAGAIYYGLFYWAKYDFNTTLKGGFLRFSTHSSNQQKKVQSGYIELMFGGSPRIDSTWILNAKLGIGGTFYFSSKTQMPLYLNIGYGIVSYPELSGGGGNIILGTKVYPKFYVTKRIAVLLEGNFDLHFCDTIGDDDFKINTVFFTGYVGIGVSFLFNGGSLDKK